MNKIYSSRIIFILILVIFTSSCGFVDRYLNEDKYFDLHLAKFHPKILEQKRKLEADVAPYIGKECKDEIRRIYGEPDDIYYYKNRDNAYGADELWGYEVYENGKRICWREFIFREKFLVEARVRKE